MTKELRIRDARQVERINRLASGAPYDIWFTDGPAMLDPRSLLGLYALVGKRVWVMAEDDADPASFGRLVDRMS